MGEGARDSVDRLRFWLWPYQGVATGPGIGGAIMWRAVVNAV